MKKLWLKNNDIPTLTTFSGNIDVDQLKPYIYLAQTTEMKRILGVELYTYIDEKIQLSQELTGNYKLIFDEYLVDILVFYSCAKYMAFGGIKITNTGFYRLTSADVQNLESKDVESLISRMNQLAVQSEESFYQFINTLDLPEWKKNGEDKENKIIPWF